MKNTHASNRDYGAGEKRRISWRRDGNRRVKMALGRFIGAALFLVLLFGMNMTQSCLQPVWAGFQGTNGKIAFMSDRDGNYEIYVMNADGTGQIRLTSDPTNDLHPAWSPDGAKIAYGNGDIYVMNADGSGVTKLTTNLAANQYPAWSPDGGKIAFESLLDGNFEIYVMNADGSGQNRLTNNSAEDMAPAWSPDGSKIAFMSHRDGNYEIYVMNADGSGQTRLTDNASADEFPAWSPDERKIAFDSNRVGSVDIWVMNPDGSGQTRLTTSPEMDFSPAWSPDGTKVAFVSNRDGNHLSTEIYVINADGTSETRLTNNQSNDHKPDWQAARLPPSAFETYRVSVHIDGGPVGYVNVLIPPDATVLSARLLGSSGVENLRNFRYEGTFSLRCYRFAQMSFAAELSEQSTIDVEVQVNRNSVSYQPAHADPLSDALMERLLAWPASGQFANGGLSFGNLEKAGDWRGYPLLSVNKNTGYQLPQSNVKYVVITSSQTESSINEFLDWKRVQGLEPFVMTTQTIDGTYVGESLQSKTKEFLKDAFNSWHMDYVLIVGGASMLPPISYQGRFAGMGWEDRTTDYYFMTLEQPADTYSRDWSTMDARYPLDFPDFILGRLPSDDLTELGNMISKTISYEQDINLGDWARTNLLVVGNNFFVAAAHDWAAYTTGRSKVSLVSGPGLDPGNLTLNALVNLINQGVGSVTMVAHASPYGWFLGGGNMSLDFETVDLLSNTRLPVIFSEGCHSGKFDVSKSVAVKLLGKRVGGAVAIVAGSSYTPYGGEVYLSAYNYEMSLPENQWRLPNADYHVGRAFFYFVALNGVIEYMDLLGDPSLVLATARYDKSTTSGGQATIAGTVRAFDMFGNLVPVEGALVVASGNGVSVSAQTHADGSFQLTVPPGTYDVAASASPPASNINLITIDGHVYGSAQDRVPLAGVNVTAQPRRVGRDFGANIVTDSSGYFNLTVRPYGSLQSSSSSLVVMDGCIASVDFHLTSPGSGSSEPSVFDITFVDPRYPTSVQTLEVSPGASYRLADVFLATQTTTMISQVTTLTAVTTVTTSLSYFGSATATDQNLVVQVESNSEVSGLVFDSTRGLLNFTVSGSPGTQGFFNVTIAKTLLHGQPVVLVDGLEHSAIVTQDASFWYICATYSHSEHHVTIGGSTAVPEFQEALFLLLALFSVTLILLRRARMKRRSIVENGE